MPWSRASRRRSATAALSACRSTARPLKLLPRSAAARVQLGDATRYALRDAKSSRREYEAALRLDPACGDARQRLAEMKHGVIERRGGAAAGRLRAGTKAAARAAPRARTPASAWRAAVLPGTADEPVS